MKKYIFATLEDSYNKIVAETTLLSSVYYHVDESDYMLFIFDEDKTDEEFIAFFKDYYKELTFEVIMYKCSSNDFENEVKRDIVENVNKFMLR